MRVLIAIDSFKGSLTSYEAGIAVKNALLNVYDSAEVVIKPLADGGEGTTEVFRNYYNADTVEITVNNPLMQPVNAQYCIINNETAIIEMASAAGLTLIEPSERNPLITTTYGVGELIKDAIYKGCRKFIIGIGGSATNDGGTGMLSALGFEFLDKDNNRILYGARGLENLKIIRTENVIDELKDCTFNIACDVRNPLCGDNGCSKVFAPQKGADEKMIREMDKWLYSYGKLAESVSPSADMNSEGAGAAGGSGFAFSAFTNATLRHGFDIIAEATDIESEIRKADLVITGEGRLDSQTVMGKAPVGIAKLAKKYNKKVIAFSGCAEKGAEICNDYGIDAYFPALRNIITLEQALNKETAQQNLYDTAFQVFRLLKQVNNYGLE